MIYLMVSARIYSVGFKNSSVSIYDHKKLVALSPMQKKRTFSTEHVKSALVHP